MLGKGFKFGGFLVAVSATNVIGVDFSQDIRPILSDRCVKCHGPGEQKGDLRLDSREAALSVIDPDNPIDSELLYRITTSNPDESMPPKKGGTKKLTAAEIELFREWIEAGAAYDRHWAYIPPGKATVPNDEHPVDHFIRRRLEKGGLLPSPQADPAVLLRRLSLDLIGLPPTVAEVDAFLADPSEERYLGEIERLLSSPHFGEKWAVRWLDLARYADSDGYQHDALRTMWPWRDWVIRAFNDDMPFDQFTIEQIAGDLLPDPTQDQHIATAFYRNTPSNFSGGTKVEEVRASLLMDRVNVTGQVWLGATMECAACHDHKFDPITQRDYYEMYAFFDRSIPEVDQQAANMFGKKFVGKMVVIPPDANRRRRIHSLENEKAALTEKLKGIEAEGNRPDPDKRFSFANGRLKKIEAELLVLGPAEVHVLKDSDAKPDTRIFERGSYQSPAERVSFGIIDALHPFPEGAPQNRLGLAQWLVDEENPLVARVAVNRWWAELFGRGIVETLDDFGMQSAPPIHPELLDWLAVDFVENGWSLKNLLRTLVTSDTYRQSAAVREDAQELDPANRLLWRSPRRRMSAEMIRDNALAIAGLLDRTRFGPPVFPPQPDGLWEEIPGSVTKAYPTSMGSDRHRRGIYVALRRGNPHPAMTNFDAGDRSLCVAQRPQTNTPIQALTLLNDPNFVEAAERFAEMIGDREGGVDSRARWAFRRALSREPSNSETRVLTSIHADDPTWFDVAQVLLNADETVSR